MFTYKAFQSLPKPAQAFFRAYFSDYQTLAFRVIPVVLVNWLITIASIILTVAPTMKTHVNWIQVLIHAGMTILWIVIILAINHYYWTKRLAIRERLYKMLKYDLGLHSFNQWDWDSSWFLKMQWKTLLFADKITAVSEVGTWSSSQLKAVKDLMANLEVMQKQPNKSWVVEYELLNQGQLKAYTVPTGNGEAENLNLKLRIMEIYKNTMGSYGNPFPLIEIEYTNEGIGNITLRNLPYETHNDYEIQKAETLLNGTLRSDYGWKVDISIPAQATFIKKTQFDIQKETVV